MQLRQGNAGRRFPAAMALYQSDKRPASCTSWDDSVSGQCFGCSNVFFPINTLRGVMGIPSRDDVIASAKDSARAFPRVIAAEQCSSRDVHHGEVDAPIVLGVSNCESSLSAHVRPRTRLLLVADRHDPSGSYEPLPFCQPID